MENFCKDMENEEVSFMKRVFNERPVLFLGCDGTHPLYADFVTKFAIGAKVLRNFETHLLCFTFNTVYVKSANLYLK